MLVAQPSVEIPETPFGAVATRQLSVWPFAARTTRLFLLIDPSLPDQTIRARAHTRDAAGLFSLGWLFADARRS